MHGAALVKLLGIGDALIDATLRVDMNFSDRFGLDRNGRRVVSIEEQRAVLNEARDAGREPILSPGGAAANTLRFLNAMGMPCAFLGGVGDDPEGEAYRSDFESSGGDASRVKIRRGVPTGTCLCLVSPDSQRTFLTCPSASVLQPDDLQEDDFIGVERLLMEGYAFAVPGLADRILHFARKFGIRVALDLGAFQCVRDRKTEMKSFLSECVDLVFANEDEAAAFADPESPTPESGLFALADLCETVVVTRGAKGAIIRSGARSFCVSAPRVRAVDANGAGDVWHGGFLYGFLRGCDPGLCGRFGSLAAAEVVQVSGTRVPPDRLAELEKRFDELERSAGMRN